MDVTLEGLEAAPIACLLDTGALRTRMSREFAELAGVDLGDTISETVPVGDVQRSARTLASGLHLGRRRPAQLGGLKGFLHHSRVTIGAYAEYVEVVPESA